MKTKLFTLFLALVASVGTMLAVTVQIGDLYYDLYGTDNTAEVIYHKNYCGLTTISIPEAITYETVTYRVTCIGEGAFTKCLSLTSVTIPSSVTRIRDGAFSTCRNLTFINIGNGVKSIGEYAFCYCVSLTSVTIPDSVTSIGNDAFSRCSGLTSVTIPNSVTNIGDNAFYGCSSLPVFDNIRYADTYLVEATNKEQSTYIIKAGTKWIGNCAFCECTNMTSVIIPSNVTSIGSYAFSNCSGLTSVIIPSNVTSIRYGAFNECRGLSTVVIQKGCQSVGKHAFYGCDNITSITIPSTLTNIGTMACNSRKIETVYNYAVTPQDMSGYGGGESYYQEVLATATLYVPQQSIDAYKKAYIWKVFGNILPLQTPEPEAVENVFGDDSSNANTGKIIKDGKVYIQRGEKVYTMTGQEVK